MMKWFMLPAVALASIEETSRLSVMRPPSLAKEFPGGIVEGTPAMFGQFAFGHSQSIDANVYFASPELDPDDPFGCSEFTAADLAKFPSSSQPGKNNLIIMVERGNCTFVSKVRHVQNTGRAVAAIIVDNVDERSGHLPYMADDNTGYSITIPSILIFKGDGKTIADAIAANQEVHMKLAWNLPHPDNRVEWELWTNSNDTLANAFKRDFRTVAEALGNHALMTPHYQFIDARATNPMCFSANPNERMCGNQCTNQGRYCDFDPDQDLDTGVSGADIVRENVRQVCLWKFLNATNQHIKWWDYVNKYETDCSSASGNWGEACSLQTMDLMMITGASADVTKCIKDAGGYGDEDGDNTIIESELLSAFNYNIFKYPTVMINGRPYRGSLSCDTSNPKNFDRNKCSVLSAICTGYEEGSAPAACTSPSFCPIGVVPDDCNRCGGTCFDCNVDECGVCQAKNASSWNQQCMGCDNVPNSNKKNDACGVCDGPGRDECDLCATEGREWVSDASLCVQAAGGGDVVFPVWGVVLIVVGCVLVVGLGVFVYMRRREDAMRQDIDSLLKQYLPMDANAVN